MILNVPCPLTNFSLVFQLQFEISFYLEVKLRRIYSYDLNIGIQIFICGKIVFYALKIKWTNYMFCIAMFFMFF